MASTKEYITPRDDIEKALVKIFEDVLEIKNIGIMDNFFELGGNSIKAIGVASKLKDAGFDFSIKDTKVYTELKSYENNKEIHNIERSYEPLHIRNSF